MFPGPNQVGYIQEIGFAIFMINFCSDRGPRIANGGVLMKNLRGIEVKRVFPKMGQTMHRMDSTVTT